MIVWSTSWKNNTIFIREKQMCYKDVRLWLWNYLQKRKIKCGGRCTFKERRRHIGINIFYFHFTIWLGGRSKDRRGEIPFNNYKRTQIHSIDFCGRMIYCSIKITHIYTRIPNSNKRTQMYTISIKFKF